MPSFRSAVVETQRSVHARRAHHQLRDLSGFTKADGFENVAVEILHFCQLFYLFQVLDVGPAWNTHQHVWELLLLTDLHPEVDRHIALRPHPKVRTPPKQARYTRRSSGLTHPGSDKAFESHRGEHRTADVILRLTQHRKHQTDLWCAWSSLGLSQNKHIP